VEKNEYMTSWGGVTKKPKQPHAPHSNTPIPSKFVIPSTATNHAVICAIALDEEPYIDEWIHYHLKLGFSHIYVYDNSDKNTLQNKTSSQVSIIHFPGKKRHLEAYDSFIVQHAHQHKWGAFIDIDEFIVLKKHKTIMEFLQAYDSCESIALNWIMFGTSHETVYKNEPVLSRFQLCSVDINPHIKCISQLRAIKLYISSHYPQLREGNIYDPNRTIVSGPPYHQGSVDIACIHHYYTKSEEEFRKKILRGTSDEHPTRSLTELDGIHLKNNDVVNRDAYDILRLR